MRTVITTPSGPIALTTGGAPLSDHLPWWTQVALRSAQAEDVPFPWQVHLADGSSVSAIRLFSGPHRERAAAVGLLRFQRAVLPAAIAEFVSYGFEGAILPASFLHEEVDGSWSAGHLLFGRSPRVRVGAEAATRKEEYERAFGPGATNLFLSFAEALASAWTASGLPPRRLGRIEIVPGSELSRIYTDFLVADGRAYLLAPRVEHDDPLWEPVVQAGLTELSWSPLPELPPLPR